MARQYPQYATFLGDASTRLRVALVAAQPASKIPQAPSKAAAATTPVQRSLAPSEPVSAVTTTLTLKKGVQLREVKILRANNAYGVRTIKPTAVSGHPCWAHDSPQGWTLRIFTDKTIEVLRTPERTFN